MVVNLLLETVFMNLGLPTRHKFESKGPMQTRFKILIDRTFDSRLTPSSFFKDVQTLSTLRSTLAQLTGLLDTYLTEARNSLKFLSYSYAVVMIKIKDNVSIQYLPEALVQTKWSVTTYKTSHCN